MPSLGVRSPWYLILSVCNKISKKVFDLIENCASARLLAKIRVSQVFWDPIKNRVSPRSALLETVYLEALLYSKSLCSSISFLMQYITMLDILKVYLVTTHIDGV